MKAILLALLALGTAQVGRAQAAYDVSPPTQAPPPGGGHLQNFFSAPEVVLPKLYEAAIAH